MSRLRGDYLIMTLSIAVMLLMILDISLGSVAISPQQILSALNADPTDTNYSYILFEMRLPRALMAILVGMSLSLAGLLMQTLFKNPLAGPYVLGISGGSSLGVALVVMAGSIVGWGVASQEHIMISSILGGLVVLALVLALSRILADNLALLIIGLMLGSLSSAVVGVLSYLSPSEELQRFVFWTLGHLGGVSWYYLLFLFIAMMVSILWVLYHTKALNAMLMGDLYAQSIGVNLQRTKWMILLVSSILTGIVTALAGPIAFVGLAVPHIGRMLHSSSQHHIRIPICLLLGAVFMLICDIISQLPLSQLILPINAVTSVIGAPLVIYLIIRKKKILF